MQQPTQHYEAQNDNVMHQVIFNTERERPFSESTFCSYTEIVRSNSTYSDVGKGKVCLSYSPLNESSTDPKSLKVLELPLDSYYKLSVL